MKVRELLDLLKDADPDHDIMIAELERATDDEPTYFYDVHDAGDEEPGILESIPPCFRIEFVRSES